MKPPLRFLRLTGVPIYQQLQLEEVLLRCDSMNYCIINSTPWEKKLAQPVSIVTGLGGKIPELVDIPKAKRYC